MPKRRAGGACLQPLPHFVCLFVVNRRFFACSPQAAMALLWGAQASLVVADDTDAASVPWELAQGPFVCSKGGELVPQAYVGDGICDCCDGSDEAGGAVPCPSECEARLARWGGQDSWQAGSTGCCTGHCHKRQPMHDTLTMHGAPNYSLPTAGNWHLRRHSCRPQRRASRSQRPTLCPEPSEGSS